MDLVYFFGRFHVLALHLPIGILFAAIGLEYFARKHREPKFWIAANTLWGFGALTAILTVALGLMHAKEAGFEGTTVDTHKWLGIAVAVVTTVFYLFKKAFPVPGRKRAGTIALITIILLSVTGHYGGNITHGSTYLVEYAPPSLQRLAGYVSRPPVTDITQADLYLDIVQPLMARRCGSCHNADKQRGELSLHNYEALMKGGKHGAIVAIGKAPTESEVMRRITLAPSEKEFMPTDGKPALTDGEISLIELWLARGATENGLLTGVETSEEHMLAAVDFLGLTVVEDLPPAASPDALNIARNLEIDIRLEAQESTMLIIDLSVSGGKLSKARMTSLQALAPNIRELNIKGLIITDEVIAAFPTMDSLKVLNMANTALNDSMLETISGKVPTLEVINLYGTQDITVAGINTLKTLEKLQRVYASNSGVTMDERQADYTFELLIGTQQAIK